MRTCVHVCLHASLCVDVLWPSKMHLINQVQPAAGYKYRTRRREGCDGGASGRRVA